MYVSKFQRIDGKAGRAILLVTWENVGWDVVLGMRNGLVVAAPLFDGDGGPAGPLRRAPQLDLAAADNLPVGWHATFADPGLPFDPNGAEDVIVAVLDTAHYADRVIGAAARPEFRRNWLLKRLADDLRTENGSLEIKYDT